MDIYSYTVFIGVAIILINFFLQFAHRPIHYAATGGNDAD